MARKKDVVKDALLTAEQIEKAALSNATSTLVEAFAPRIQDVFQTAINEELGNDGESDPYTENPTSVGKGEIENKTSDKNPTDWDETADTPKGELQQKSASLQGVSGNIKEPADTADGEIDTPLTGAAADVIPSGVKAEGTDHDIGKQPGNLPRDGGKIDSDLVDEETFPGPDDNDREGISEEDDYSMDDDDEEVDLDITEDDEIELEPDDEDDDDIDVADIPPQDELEDDEDVFEDEDTPGEDEELEIPDELFNDGEDELPADDDQPLVDDDEELDIDLEDDEEEMLGGEEEQYEEGLYVRREGEFRKVSAADALEDQLAETEAERDKLAGAVGYLRDQLEEVNLFNAKLAHTNRLFESGLFSKREKHEVAIRIDECTSINKVKSAFKAIAREVQDRNPLDDIHNTLNEQRTRRAPSGEQIYESREVSRMKTLAGIK